MDQIHHALLATLSPNQAEREAAEGALKALAGTPGYLSTLFGLVSSAEAKPEVRQAGAILFKNLVVKHWENKPAADPSKQDPDDLIFAEEDKQNIRQHLLESLVNAVPQTRPQIVECVRRIAGADYPAKLPNFLQQIASWLEPSHSPHQLFAAALALRALVKNYEYKSQERRLPLNDIMALTFPRLVHLMEATLSAPPADEAAAETMKVVIKTLHSCIHQSVPLYMQSGDVFMTWMGLLYRAIERPVPPEVAGGAGPC